MAQIAQLPDANHNRQDSQQAEMGFGDHQGKKGPGGTYKKQSRHSCKLAGNNILRAESAVRKEGDQYDEIIDIGRGK